MSNKEKTHEMIEKKEFKKILKQVLEEESKFSF